MIVKTQIFNILGCLSFLLGLVGVFLPILPTTPFILLASFFFSKGSPRFYKWITNLKYFGEKIKAWDKYGIIDKPSKIIASLTLIIILLNLIFFFSYAYWLKCLFVITFLAVLLFINTRPNSPTHIVKSQQSKHVN